MKVAASPARQEIMRVGPSFESNAAGASPASADGFESLGLSPPLREAVRAAGYHEPTPIQRKAIPHVLAGRDVLGCAQTGTGKTAAFALPILHQLLATPRSDRRPEIRALVLAPTRELAAQIGESFRHYGIRSRLRHYVIFGGVGKRPQIEALRRGLDVLVATPGRLLDLLRDRHLALGRVHYFVLDEADRMLDMGFIHDVRCIARRSSSRRPCRRRSRDSPAGCCPIRCGSPSIRSPPLASRSRSRSTSSTPAARSICCSACCTAARSTARSSSRGPSTVPTGWRGSSTGHAWRWPPFTATSHRRRASVPSRA